MTRILLWLAEITDRWARTATRDDGAEQLANAEACIDCWEIDHGDFVAEVVYLDEHVQRRATRRRHPAGKAL